MNSFPLIVGHDGCENSPSGSLLSVQEAFKNGADIAEIDVRPTKDGVVILRHDEDLQLVGGGRVLVNECTYDTLKSLEEKKEIVFPDRREKITRLETVFEYLRTTDRLINIDLKGMYCIDSTVQALSGSDMRQHVIISGCDQEMAEYIRRIFPSVSVLLNVEVGKDSYIPITEKKREPLYSTVLSTGCTGINIDYRYCSEEVIDYFQKRHVPVCVWTIDTQEEMEKFLCSGVHTITTNRVAQLVELKKKYKEYRRKGR